MSNLCSLTNGCFNLSILSRVSYIKLSKDLKGILSLTSNRKELD